MLGADQDEAVRELERARHQLAQLERLSSIGSWSWDFGRDEVTVSPGFREIFGLPDQAVPFTYDEVISFVDGADRMRIGEILTGLRAGGEPALARFRIRRPDGEPRDIEGRAEAVGDGGVSDCVRGVVQDITARVRAERQREAMLAVTGALADAREVDEAVAAVLEALAETTGWQAATFWLLDPSAERLRCERVWLAPGLERDLAPLAEASEALEVRRGEGIAGAAWAGAAPVWHDVEYDETAFPRREGALAAGLRGVLAFPLLAGGEVIGVIDLWRTPEGRPGADIEELVASFGRQIGQFVDRIRAEERLRESRRLNERIVDAAIDCVITIDADGIVREFNPAAERTFGYSREQAVGRELAALVVPERYRDRHRRGLERLRAGGSGRLLGDRIELEAIRADGEEFPVELTITPISDDPPAYTGWLRDITKRRRAERAASESQALLAQTQRMAQIGSWQWNVEEDEVIAGDEVLRLLGIERENTYPTLDRLLAAVDADNHGILRDAIDRCARTGSEVRFLRIPVSLSSGERRVLEWFADAVDESGGRSVRGTCQDVTPEYTLETELATRARQQAAVAAFGSVALTSPDLDSLVERALQVVCEILGIEHTAVTELRRGGEGLLLRAGTGWSDGIVGELVLPPGRGSHAGCVIERGEPVISEDLASERRFSPPAQLPDHGMVSCVGVVIAGEAGPFGTLGAYAPERRRFSDDDVAFLQGIANVLAAAFAADRMAGLERQLQQAQRLDSVGKLAGGIAHDFNNLLSVILNYADFALDEIGSEAARPEIEEIKLAARRAAELTRQLLLFSRKDVTSAEVIDPADVVGGVEAILRRTLGEHLRLNVRVDPGLGRVAIAESLLEQVVLNLVLNARDAMPDGGEITIELANARADQAVIAPTTGPHLRLSVKDTGAGMTPEVLDRAFEPFFTTKPEGEGTGLGLATTYGVVQRAGGSIEVESSPGAGTAVHVYLPAREAAAPDGAQRVEAPPMGGSETILLVEDEEAVRRLSARILERAGYTVLDANGPEAATEIWSRRAAEVDLLLTDVVMPGRSGVRLWQELSRSRPGLPVIYMSGYAGEAVSDRGGVLDPGALLQKPFSGAELLRTVRVALPSRAAPS